MPSFKVLRKQVVAVKALRPPENRMPESFAEKLILGTAVAPANYLNERSSKALARYREFLSRGTEPTRKRRA
jgi:hypothetical protein